mmetsp:Transcript_1356/g.3481  ORF Transcript_1356/g.3481 Transcript_1356/m.3481 type:complete len:537 (-) Transcript_1356:585-2195(-)
MTKQIDGGRKRALSFPERWFLMLVGLCILSVAPYLLTTSCLTMNLVDVNDSPSLWSSSSSSSSSSFRKRERERRVYLDEAEPVYQFSLKNPTAPDAPFDLIHSVLTRFMVGQGPKEGTSNKYELTRAHFLLFKTFTWASIKHQTRQNFFWIVLMDPSLDKGVIDDARKLLGKEHFPEENAYLVLTDNIKWSEDGTGVPGADHNGIGLPVIVEAYRKGEVEILTGNKDRFLGALDAVEGKKKNNNENNNDNDTNNDTTTTTKPILMIETNLDADDGLHNSGVEWSQETAIEHTLHHRKGQLKTDPNSPVDLETTWWHLCGEDFMEWHNREVYLLDASEFAARGISSGLAGLRRKPIYCRSSGYSRVGIALPGDKREFPRDAHINHSLMYNMPECSSPGDTQGSNFRRCWRREFRLEESAFSMNGRAITSDSMDHLNPDDPMNYGDISGKPADENPLTINLKERYWQSLRNDFTIDRVRTWETSVFLFQNRKAILRQNRESRCVPGWPCKPTASTYQSQMEYHWQRQEQAAANANANA